MTPGPVPGGRVGSSTLWNFVQFGGGRAVTFVSTMVLARLLAPEHFGLLALGLLAVNIFDRMKDVGVGAAVVQYKGPFAEIARSANTLTLATSLLLAGAGAASAPLLASFLGDERLVPIVQALSLAMLVSGIAVLPDSLLRRQLLFRARAVPEIGGAIVKALVSIAMALGGVGVWSLVWGQLASSVFTTAAYWRAYLKVRPQGPLFGWSWQPIRQLLRYGIVLSGVALIALILDNLDNFAIGRRLGPEQLGYYTLAFRLPDLIVVSMCQVVGQVLFASFSRLQDDVNDLRHHYLKATGTVTTLTVPLGLGLSATAPDVVTVVLGPAYQPAGVLLMLLSLQATLTALVYNAGEVYKATGRAYLLIRLAIARLFVFAPALWFAAGTSTVAVASVSVVLNAAFAVISLLLIRHVLSLGYGEQMRAYWPPLASGFIMAVCVMLLRTEIFDALPVLPRLLTLIVSGAFVYIGVLRLIDRAAVRSALYDLRAMRDKSQRE